MLILTFDILDIVEFPELCRIFDVVSPITSKTQTSNLYDKIKFLNFVDSSQNKTTK